MNTQYLEATCYLCEVRLAVPTHDVSDRYYCQTCGFSKLMYDNRTDRKETNERD